MRFLKTYFLVVSLLLSALTYAQFYNNFYGNIVSQCSFDSINNNLTEFENLGVKEHGTVAQKNTLNWLINKYTNYGYTDITIDTFNYFGIDAYNLIVTKQGTIYPNTYLIVDGHYDTKNGTGTNDNGSGVSIILEVARLLQNINTQYSIKFINFSAEEIGLAGSTHYVNNIVAPNSLNIKLVLNIDEVGGVSGMTNDTIVCERDESSPTVNNVISAAYTDTLANCVVLYSNLFTKIFHAYSSDYMPFQSNNEIITGLFERNQSSYPHTSSDLKVNMDVNYVYEIAKASVGASLYFAVAYLTTGIKKELNNKLVVYPNPVKNVVTINFNESQTGHLIIRDVTGREVMAKILSQTKKLTISLQKLPLGIYFIVLTDSEIGLKHTCKIIKLTN